MEECLQSTDLPLLEWVDQHYGSCLTSDHFYQASERWTLYCLEHDRHLPLIIQHAWHLLPPLFGKSALYHLLYFGTTPPRHDQWKMATVLLQPYLNSQPSLADIQRACQVAPNEETVLQLQAYVAIRL